jgi:hypothetical protein
MEMLEQGGGETRRPMMATNDHRLYEACAADYAALVRDAGGEEAAPRTVDDICTLLERRLGIAIRRYPASLGGHPQGVVLRGKDLCLILYERQTSAWHQQAIILHECAHLLYNHGGTESGTAAALRVLIPDVPHEQFAVVLHRAVGAEGHRSEDERQAEAFATVGLARLSRMQGQPLRPVPTAESPDDPAVGVVIRRLLEDFAAGTG